MSIFSEDIVERAAIDWLGEAGYSYVHGPDIAPGERASERVDYRDVLLVGRLRTAIERINPHLPHDISADIIDSAIQKVVRPVTADLLANNHAFHLMLTEGVDVSYHAGGIVRYDKVWLVDFASPHNNDFLVVNQYTVLDVNLTSHARTNRRPDILLFINGMPLVIIELKNAADEKATLDKAFKQLHTYKDDIPSLMGYTALSIISDGREACVGTLTGGLEWYKVWRTVDGIDLDPYPTQLETTLKGVCAPAVLLDLIQHFTVFDTSGAVLEKKIAAYHQYYAVNKAVQKTIEATSANGNRRVGVVWHTQGSGKSLSMLFYAGKVIRQAALENPTVVVLTDRNDLDDQLLGTFSTGHELLRQAPQQADSRDHLRDLLRVASGGVVFTTIQKFGPDAGASIHPLLSDRRNIVFIADEAHRSQYGFEARYDKERNVYNYGFAKYVREALPNASFIGFTGTPIETSTGNTVQVFGSYIDVYDIQRAIDDGATVPIYYEARMARVNLRDEMRALIDPEFDLITEGEEDLVKEQLKSRWSQLEAMVGTPARLNSIAADIVEHFALRQSVMDGKGMIVCISRRVAADLYKAICILHPDWHNPNDTRGAIKVVMTGSASDEQALQPHIRNDQRRKAIADRFKDPEDELKLVIVCDMWLTGFDVPPLHTLYIDKSLSGHTLMQAIARVNRVFRDKPGGLIVDYLGIASELERAVAKYTVAHHGKPTLYQDEAVKVFLTQLDVVRSYFHGFNFGPFFDGTPAERLNLMSEAMEHILATGDTRKKEFLVRVSGLAQALALSIPHPDAIAARDEVAFYQAIRAMLVKYTVTGELPLDELHVAVKQIVSQAVTSTGIVEIFGAAGIKRPDVAILSDEFLEEVKKLPQKNLAIAALQRILDDQIKLQSHRNVIRSRSFAERLQATLLQYQNRTIDGAQIILDLIDLARELRTAGQRGDDLGLSEVEIAFYDALAENESALTVLGDKQLAVIATELVNRVRENVTVDWTVREAARAKLRVLVKRILRHYGYPPDLQEKATTLVLEQAELLAAEWAASSVL